MMALAVSPSLLVEAESRLGPMFGLGALRPWQRDAMRALLEGSGRVLVVAPTGGGKSLTYQLPAVVLPRVTIVLSPLVALMEDQVHALEEKGIAATYIASTLSLPERRSREDGLARGAYKIVYAAPERLANGQFVDLLRRAQPSLIAVDEAHCISQWGHDFRPDYLRVGELLESLKPERVLACTATATPDVRKEIVHHLGFAPDRHDVVLRGFARPNLHLSAVAVDGPRDVQQRIRASLLRALGAGTPQGAAIIYCATRKKTEDLAEKLSEPRWRVGCYHAGLSAEERTRVSNAFASKELDIVVATNAFGMGIDRDDVRIVMHAQPPSSIEAYYQEVGRAGRDGLEAHGLLMCSGSDIALRRRLVEMGSNGERAPKEQVDRAWKLFRELLTFLDARTCRHDFVLRYFGDENEVLGGCGHCDVCESEAAIDDEDESARDATKVIVQKALSGVARANRRAGIAAVASMLVGSDDDRTRRFGFTRLSTFGLFKDERVEWVTALLRALLAAGWIDLTPTEHPVPFVTKSGWDAMRGLSPVRMILPSRILAATPSQRKPKAREGVPDAIAHDELFVRLRDHRASIARARQVPAYVVAHDRTLVELVKKRPRTLGDLDGVHGFGPSRIEQYGEGFLAVINPI